jgi:hypothetical protein
MSEAIFMTPSDLIDQMSFSPPKKEQHRPLYEPLAPPPAAPPPSPPPQAALKQPLPASFGNESSSSSSRRAQVPRVTNYDSYQDSSKAAAAYGGDATIRPNVGEANSADGDALPELLWKLRVVNLAACSLSILLEIPAFLGHFLLFKWDRAVLGFYLMAFCLVLILYEIHTPAIASPLQDCFGLIYHPLGRAFYLLLMGGLCFGQSWIFLMVVGVVFWISAGGTLFAYIKFPQYRRQFQDEHPRDLWMVARSRYSWAQPEREGLLHSIVQPAVAE